MLYNNIFVMGYRVLEQNLLFISHLTGMLLTPQWGLVGEEYSLNMFRYSKLFSMRDKLLYLLEIKSTVVQTLALEVGKQRLLAD